MEAPNSTIHRFLHQIKARRENDQRIQQLQHSIRACINLNAGPGRYPKRIVLRFRHFLNDETPV